MKLSLRDLVPAFALLITATEATAGTWRCGVLQTDCPEGCHFFGETAVQQAMLRPEVLPGDTVMVWPGDYPAKVVMKSGLVLLSNQGPAVTRFVGQGGAEAAITMSGSDPLTTICGFTFTWNSLLQGLGGGIAAFAAAGEICDNVFLSSEAGIGSGIYLQSCNLLVQNNLFVSNNCLSGGGTIAISGGVPTIRNNTFSANHAPFGLEGAAIYATGTNMIFDRNIVHGSQGASAVFCGGGNHPTISCNLFWDNPFGAFAGQCIDSVGTSGNVAEDPLFCNASAQNYGVCTDSPALTGPCGTIGYTSPTGNCPACQPTFAVSQSTWGRLKSNYRQP